MERRAFLAAAAGLAAAGTGAAQAGAGIGSAAPGAAMGAEARVVVRSYLTAIPSAAAEGLAAAGAGQRLHLAVAAHRRFDPQSVAVRDPEGALLGYLPGRDSRILAPLLEHGLTLEARVVARRTGRRPGLDLDVVLAG